MPEGMNLEIARELSKSTNRPANSFPVQLLEISEAVVLAVVAVATAWSGYQAAKWDGQQAFEYGNSSRLRVEAGIAATEGGQQRLLDVCTFNTWIQARETGDKKLADIYVRRLSPEYRAAFEAWLKTDPFTNRDAPAGPLFMPQYHNALLGQSDKLNEEATLAFSQGTQAREIAEKYVRGTVLLATVLFLIALAQRFQLRKVRIGLLVLAAGLMFVALVFVLRYPRL
jgi:hypothetical protein